LLLQRLGSPGPGSEQLTEIYFHTRQGRPHLPGSMCLFFY
jgi:hypothetical protein